MSETLITLSEENIEREHLCCAISDKKHLDSAAAAKAVPGVFNNWAVFLNGQIETVHLLNENLLKKLLAR